MVILTIWKKMALGIVLLVWMGSAVAQTLTAQVDRPRVGLDETFRLTLVLDGEQSQADPDLTRLEQHFDILGSQRSQQINVINGQMQARTQWTVTLAPRETGTFTIPSIQVGSWTSEPVPIEVVPAREVGQGEGTEPIFLEAEVDEKQPYVQAQVVYTVRLYYALDLQEANLSDPAPSNAIVERLGSDAQFQTRKNGRNYRVVERRYAMFPQESGTLTIPSVVLSGQVPESREAGARGGFFGGFAPFDRMLQPTRRVRVRSPEVTLQIQPRPSEAQGTTWLPAESLTLRESWSPDPPEFRVGEPVTRTISLLARGLTAAQLPEIPVPTNAGVKVYPDQPVTQTTTQGIYVLGKREQKQALVPTEPGHLVLPAVRISWWDTAADQPKTTLLAEREIEVLPALPSASQPAPVPAQSNPLAASQAPMGGPQASQPSSAESALAPWWPATTGVLLLAWLTTVALWWRDRHPIRHTSKTENDRDTTTPSLRSARHEVEKACQDNDPHRTRAALLAWGTARWPNQPPINLGALATRLENDSASAELMRLDQQLYGRISKPWSGQYLWKAVAPSLTTQAKTRPRRRRVVLPALYPERST